MDLTSIVLMVMLRSLLGEALPTAILKHGPVMGFPEPLHLVDPTGADSFDGTVQSLSPTSITMSISSKLVFQVPLRGEDPFPCLFPGIVLPRASRRFIAIEPLARGGVAIQRIGHENGYRLSDVHVGDLIVVDTYRIRGQEMIRTIRIVRRPGGKIPPVPGSDARSPYRYHERMQAYQDYEEKGTPVPEVYLPPSKRKQQAPLPREYVPSIPPAKP